MSAIDIVNATKTEDWLQFPGGEIIAEGLADVAVGRVTPAACAVWIAEPRLRRAGLLASSLATPIIDPELTLYRLLSRASEDGYSRYNAILRRLVRFEHALDRETARRSG